MYSVTGCVLDQLPKCVWCVAWMLTYVGVEWA